MSDTEKKDTPPPEDTTTKPQEEQTQEKPQDDKPEDKPAAPENEDKKDDAEPKPEDEKKPEENDGEKPKDTDEKPADENKPAEPEDKKDDEKPTEENNNAAADEEAKKKQEEEEAAKKKAEEAEAEKKKAEEEEAAKKKEEEEAAEKKRKEEEEEKAKLEAELKELEERVEAKKKALAEKRETRDKEVADEADVKNKLKELEAKKDELVKDNAAKKKEEDQLQAPYDRAVANRELKDRANACKEKIANQEKTLSDNNNTIEDLKKHLDEVGAKYKSAVERRDSLVSRLKDLVNDMHQVTSSKIDSKSDSSNESTEQKSDETPFELIDYAGDLVLEREREIENNLRLARELEAIIELKRETADKLEKETNDAIDSRRKERHERIKDFVFNCQQERNTLHADIQEVRRVNKEDAAKLARGHVEKTKKVQPGKFTRYDSTSITQRRNTTHSSSALGGARLLSSRKTEERPDPVVPQEQKDLKESNGAMQKELNACLSNVKNAHEKSTQLARDTKAVENRRRQEAEAQAQTRRVLEDKIVGEVKRIKDHEAEACRLTDAISHLTQVLKVTKSHTERVRCATAPLPIEEE